VEVVHGISKLHTQVSKSVVTIGNFDGLHYGHREIISNLVSKARQKNAQSVVVTFNPHPRKILHPEVQHEQLFDQEDQERELEKMGVDLLVIEPFSRDLSQLTPEKFLSDYIIKPLSPEVLIVGYDFAFGANRQGTLSTLEKLCEQNGLELEIINPIKMEGLVISSSEIRKSIREGHVDIARKMLGRSFYIKGLVEKGEQRGRALGFPTANLSTSAEIFPKEGVYASYVRVRSDLYKSVTNVGYSPTFVHNEKNKILKVETHILNFDKDIYGEEIEVHFEHFIRPEKKFESPEKLKSQIQYDISNALNFLEPMTC
jgi:riboflavin kinase / FMN adenylyltransferase